VSVSLRAKPISSTPASASCAIAGPIPATKASRASPVSARHEARGFQSST
jgi:hypothetical protein